MPDLKYVQATTTKRRSKLVFIPIILLILALIAFIGFYLKNHNMIPEGIIPDFTNVSTASNSDVLTSSSAESSESVEETTVPAVDPALTALLSDADKLALSYDYDGAIDMLSTSAFADTDEVKEALASYESTKSTLVRQDTEKITHVFFHTLIWDTSKAFDGDSKEGGYNQVMTTADEFVAMMTEMYNRGFVLVSLHDIAYEVDDTENGGKKMAVGDIFLPEGKQAFVLSQDDVCYYEYMEGDGFASRLIVGEDGKPTCEMDMDDGTTQTGSFDLIPMLDDFIDEHPDFSYKGAKGVIALTGYNGIFGYRTAPSYSENPTYEEDKEKAKAVAQCLRDDGWELASHSWGHRYLGDIPWNEFTADCDKWQDQVAPLIGGTDIILFPFGTDVSDWNRYTSENDRYMYLRNEGFRYFCNVDSSQYWVQFGHDYFRQGRRDLDGYRMWRDITEPDNPRLSDLFDSNVIFDSARPTPVPAMGNTYEKSMSTSGGNSN